MVDRRLDATHGDQVFFGLEVFWLGDRRTNDNLSGIELAMDKGCTSYWGQRLNDTLTKRLPLAIAGLLAIPVSIWAQDPSPHLEAEFVASDIFRSGSLVAQAWKGLNFDGQYFGTESVEAGITALSWEFRWKQLSIFPGFGAGFGSGVDTAPMLILRWKLETRRWFSQGYAAQSLLRQVVENEAAGHTIYASVLDDNHISVRLGPTEIGGLWEHTKYREENEWKGGLRGAVRFGEHFKLIVQSVWPDWELRGGVGFEK